MSQEELRSYIDKKWSNYSRGLAMSFSFRKEKNLTFKDVEDAFTSGFYEFQQILHKNNIKLESLKLE